MRLSMASMLEGFVSQLLADYLGNYVQGIHPEQFRLGLWSGVAQLENVKLRLEAFDYLQLPIAIKKGVVGKLKIQVPWKKLGREPIVIALENVYLCACPRDEFEWKSEALEARSVAAKKAKLAAAELAKLSVRISGGISDDQSNQSFLTFLSTKILDNMQVIAENLHFQYIDQKTDPEMAFSFGIKLSHLTMNTEHTFSGLGTGKVKANLVNKLVEVKEFSLYWNPNEDDGKEFLIERNSPPIIARSQDKWSYLIHPFDASLRFMVNKSTLLDGTTPRYSTTLEICDLQFTLEDRQLHEMLLLWDALYICQMREKYGRFRPAVGQNGFNRREHGWQKVWWHYAVQAVLVDVRRNMRRTSWSYLGWRIWSLKGFGMLINSDMRRKYVVLYKEKLDCLWTGKPAADQSLCKLEELEKELDLDEILSFRSTAESSLRNQGLPEQLEEDKESERRNARSEVKADDLSSWKQRSWLNFLSLGMLGAAGSTGASEQFAGVLPDEIIEDIFEATEYHPLGSEDHGELSKGSCRFAITCCIGGITITLWHLHPKEAIASLEIKTMDARIRAWHQSTKYLVTVKALRATDHCQKLSAYPVVLGNEGSILPQISMTGHNEQTYAELVSGIFQKSGEALYNGLQSKEGSKGPFIVVEVEALSDNKEFDLIVKVAMQPAEFVYSPMLMKGLNTFLNRPTSLQTLKDLIFSSLDRLQSPQIRLQSKAELTLAMGKRVSLLFDVQRPILIFPNSLQTLDSNHLIVVMNSLQVTSIDQKKEGFLNAENGKLQRLPSFSMAKGLDSSPRPCLESSEACISEGSQFISSALYDKYHLRLHGTQVIVAPHLFNWRDRWKGFEDLDNFHLAKCFDAEAVFEICVLPDEPTLTRFKLHGNLPPLQLTLSPAKWKMFQSLFSDLSEEEMAGHDDLYESLSVPVAGMRIGSSGSGNSAPFFKLELISNTLSLMIHSDEDKQLQHHAIFFAKGEGASLVFTDTNFQQELNFSVTSVHVDEALRVHDNGPFLSVHSMSHLSFTGLFVPTTVWKWDWQASQMIFVLRGDDTVSRQKAVVVSIEDMELMGSWKDDRIDCFSCMAGKVRMKVVNCLLDCDNVSLECHLCTTNHRCVVYALKQHHCHELLVCEPMETHFGLKIDLLEKEEDEYVIVSMPFAKVDGHLASWSVSLQILSLYLGSSGVDKGLSSQKNLSDILDPDAQEMDKQAVLHSHGRALIIQTCVMSISVILSDFCHTNLEVHAFDMGNSYTSGGRPANGAQRKRSISSKLNFQVEKFCYRDVFCNLEASILKCEVNLIDSISGCSQCLPLLQVTDMQVKSDIELKSFNKSISLVGSCLMKRLDVWFSHSILQFWRSFRFEKGQQAASTLDFETIEVTTCLQRGSILLTDGRWNYNAPIFELRVKNMDSQMNFSSSSELKSMVSMLLEADYHNMEKVAWEPFLEPWNLLCDVSLRVATYSRMQQMNCRFSSSRQLNVNVTKAFLQASCRAVDLFADASDDHTDSCVSSNSKKAFVGYAPYWLQNGTGVSIKYWLVGALRLEDADGFVEKKESGGGGIQNVVEPGSSLPIYIEETPEQVFHKGRLNSSSERLSDKKLASGQHRMIRVQLEGTSNASVPMSMDLVGAHTFYVTFSHASSNGVDGKRKEKSKTEGKNSDSGDNKGSNNAFQTPVVFEVSGHYYSKVIRIYSTVSLVNATSVPMEVRFDIPFGLLPKVMEPILPGEVIPLPVHLAETGQIRWRPMGNSHLWSETQSLSHILSASKLATLRSFVSYPSNPSNAIFRCCITVRESMGPSMPISAAVSERLCKSTTSLKNLEISSELGCSVNKVPSTVYELSSNPIVRELTFQAPFVFKNCLPLPLALVIRSSAGLHLSIHVPEGDSIFVLEANTGHELALTLNVPGFLPASTKLTCTTALLECHKEAPQNEITYAETLNLFPESAGGHTVYAKSESLFDLVSGAREFSIFVPFWFYNHSGVSLGFVDGDVDLLSIDRNLITEQVSASFSMLGRQEWNSVTKSSGLQTVLHEPFGDSNMVYTHGQLCGTMATRSLGGGKTIISCVPSKVKSTDSESSIPELQQPKPDIYSPVKDLESWDCRLRARVILSSSMVHAKASQAGWSRPFSLNPPGGMTTIVIPTSKQEEGLILSVVSASVLGAAAGKTRTVTFQPRFILANICNQDLCYRQQGTDTFEYLLKGKQAHLLWSDMSRPLLVSVRFDQHGWDWSGAFVPDQLGDTQLKIRNLATGVTQILRVEVQNAMSVENELNDISGTDNSLGTYLILLSNDESGFMPYRIENFSLERLRFYQSKCTDFESTLLPYSSCLYAWDEPWLPHQLVLEIPGEGCLGTFDLDDVREYPAIHTAATNQKPERWFLIGVHAEGPARVLSFQDLHLHPKKDCLGFLGEGLTQQTINEYIGCAFTFDFCFASIGISIIDTFPQEILFASAKEVTLQLSQSAQEQKFSMSISYIQFDNQLPLAQYPVMLLVGVFPPNENSGLARAEGFLEGAPSSNAGLMELSAFGLVVSKWRHLANSVDYFQKIEARFAPLQLQLDELVISCLTDFFRTASDMGCHTLYPNNNDPSRFFAGNSSLGCQRYRLTLDPKSTHLHLQKILQFEAIYRCWPASRATKCLQIQNADSFLLARGGRKIYIEALVIAPIEVTVSFSSIPWSDRHRSATRPQSVIGETGPSVQRSLMALIDIEGASVQLKQLSLAHPLARWDAIRGMITRHYTRQFLHGIYKVLGSAGFLGNPVGFMKSVGSGVRDFVSAPARSIVQNPKQLAGGFAEGTQSLVNNTIFAVSSAATLISKAARKGVTTLALRHQPEPGIQDYGVISELLEGLTGLLQSPVTGVQRHGLPGILSGVAVGAVGVVARPIASILEVAGRTAQSIQSWSQPIQQAKRIRPPRYLSRGSPLLPYSLEEAVGNAVLLEAAGARLQNEVYITCRPLLEAGRYAVLTGKYMLIVRSTSVTHSGQVGPQWIIDLDINLEDVLHAERNGEILSILMGAPRCPSRTRSPKKTQVSVHKKQPPTSSLLLHESFALATSEDAEELFACLNYLFDERRKSKTNLVHL